MKEGKTVTLSEADLEAIAGAIVSKHISDPYLAEAADKAWLLLIKLGRPDEANALRRLGVEPGMSLGGK